MELCSHRRHVSGFNGPPSLGDHDHEGHTGALIRDLDANIVGWLRNSAPRTILLHIGTFSDQSLGRRDAHQVP